MLWTPWEPGQLDRAAGEEVSLHILIGLARAAVATGSHAMAEGVPVEAAALCGGECLGAVCI